MDVVGKFVTSKVVKKGALELKFRKGVVATSIVLHVGKEDEGPESNEIHDLLYGAGMISFKLLEEALGIKEAQRIADICGPVAEKMAAES